MTRGRRHPLFLALAVSMLFHALAVFTFPVPEGGAVVPVRQPIEVALLDPPPPPEPVEPEPEPQIVSPPDEVNEQEPDETRFQSDHDNVVLQETVRKGVPNPAPPEPQRKAQPEVREEPSESQPPPAEAAPREPDPGHAPALEDLFASTDELVRAQQGKAAHDTPPEEPSETSESERRLARAVAPAAPTWSLPGPAGTLDHLPSIQRGDVTLLNTKANVFAPFVRRVGERVFQHLIIRQRRLEIEQILSAREYVKMRVLLDPQGRLRSVTLEGQSGSATMDRTLADALDTAAFDNNPPRAAANTNGDYEFLFQARLRAVQQAPRGRPSRIESRLSVALL